MTNLNSIDWNRDSNSVTALDVDAILSKNQRSLWADHMTEDKKAEPKY